MRYRLDYPGNTLLRDEEANPENDSLGSSI
jgi:hypothetical protein